MTPDLQAGPYRLRALAPSDADRLHALINDWSVVRMLSRPPFPYPRDLTDEWIAETVRTSTAGSAFHFAITDPDDRLLGCVGLRILPGRAASVGYWIGRSHWGQGIATTCARRIASWALATLPIDTLRAWAAIDNPASAAVLRKIGFRETGKDMQRFASRGGEHQVGVFEAKRADLAPDAESIAGSDEGSAPVPKRLIMVVAAVLVDARGRVLLARRPEGKPLAGLWEFPGGKVEPGEEPVAALRRELAEELGLDMARTCLAPLTFVSTPVGRNDLLLMLYVGRIGRQAPVGREGQALLWAPPEGLRDYDMPEPDRPLPPLLLDLLGPAGLPAETP